MSTPAQLAAATVAAEEAEAVADLAVLQALSAAQGPNFNALVTALNAGKAQLASAARQTALANIIAELQGSLGDFQTLISTATAAETNPPAA